MKSLPFLISKSNWTDVCERLKSNPEQASIPIPTHFKKKVYPLHQAVCNKAISRKVLLFLIEAFPEALDLNAFQGACENSKLSRGAMEILLDRANPKLSKLVEENANRCVFVAVKKQNVNTTQLFIERYPFIVDGNLLTHACAHGTPKILDSFLSLGLRLRKKPNIRAGGLFLKNENKEDTLEVAIRLYDENDDERCNILSICLQYACTTERKGLDAPEPDYPVILAAIGWVPSHILESIQKRNAHEINNTDSVGKYAILKSIDLAKNENQPFEIPDLFYNHIFITACRCGTLETVQQLLAEGPQYAGSGAEAISFKSRLGKENALNVAICLFNEEDRVRCEILRSCVQYANALKMGLKYPTHDYPTILAAIGLVPRQILTSLGKIYRHEFKKTDKTGKAALKKVLYMAQKVGTISRTLNNTSTVMKSSLLGSISEDEEF